MTDQQRFDADVDQFVSLIQAAVILRLRPDYGAQNPNALKVEAMTRTAAAEVLSRLVCPFVPDTTPGGDEQGRSS